MTRIPAPALILAGPAALMLSACDKPLDLDVREVFGNAPSTAEAARNATADRPRPDRRGIISYPGYQVAVAKRGDTVGSLAARIGTNPDALARYNGMQVTDSLRKGEIIALPSRVAEPAGGPIQPTAPAPVDITTLANGAIDNAGPQPVATKPLDPAPQTGAEPVRHKVERGESAYTIARLYNVSIRSLAEWNGLGSDFAVREGQYLLIPVAAADGKKPAPFDPGEVAQPGQGSPTPTPPSASKPLPEETTTPAAQPVTSDAAPDLGSTQTKSSSKAKMAYPIRGDIVREYSKGKNDGIDIAGSPGARVNAAANGVVAAITKDTNGVPIIVVKHPDNLLTVYSNVDNVAVKKGDTVSRGGKLAEIRKTGSSALHFEIRKGFDSVDPIPYLQ